MFLRDIWPAPKEVEDEILRSVKAEMFKAQYSNVFHGDDNWRSLPVPEGDLYAWDADSTYVKNPPFFDGMTLTPPGIRPINGARAARHVRRFDHHRSHLARRLDSRRRVRPASG